MRHSTFTRSAILHQLISYGLSSASSASSAVQSVFSKWVLALLFLIFLSAIAQAAPLPASVAKALREAGIPPASVGVFVQDVAARKPLIAHQGGTR